MYDVTVRRFDRAKDFSGGTVSVLPSDGLGEEHATSAAMSNAIAFTRKRDGGTLLSVAFACTGVSLR